MFKVNKQVIAKPITFRIYETNTSPLLNLWNSILKINVMWIDYVEGFKLSTESILITFTIWCSISFLVITEIFMAYFKVS